MTTASTNGMSEHGSEEFETSRNVIAWSKVGLIAFAPCKHQAQHISKSTEQNGLESRGINDEKKSKVYVTYIYCSDGETWKLHEPEAVEEVDKVHEGAEIVHLCWSYYGIELAIVDSVGRLSIFAFNGNLNQLKCIYKALLPEDQFGETISGFRWLNMNKPILISNPVARQENRQFHYGIHKASPFGPWHPHSNKQACIAVTRTGKLKLWYQQHDAFYHELVTDVESDLASEDYYSTSAFGSDRDDTFVLAVYSKNRHMLKLFRIAIQWNVLATGAASNNQQIQNDVQWATISVRRLYTNQLYCPNNFLRNLTQLRVVSPTNHPESRLTVFATFASKSGTTIQKIEVLSLPILLHSNFDALGLRRNPIPDNQNDVIQFADTYEVPKQLIGIESLYADTILFLSYGDGSVEVRSRDTFTISTPNFNYQSIHSLFDAGFTFLQATNAINICMSPNMVAFVLLNEEGEVKLHSMINVMKPEDGDISTPTAVALALRHTVACYSNISCDDLMLIAGSKELNSDPEFYTSVLKQCHRSIGFSLDLPKDVQADKFLVLPSLQKLLSFQASLGAKKGWYRNTSGMIAWVTLNLRLLAFALTFTLKATHQKQAGSSEIDLRGDTILTLLGLAKWCVDFLVYLLQDICELERNMEKFFQPGASSVALVMLLGAVPRLLIRYTLRGLRGLEQLVARSANQETDILGLSRQAFRELEEILKSGPVQIALFEKLVNDIETFMRNTYPDNSDRLQIEQTLFFKGSIPIELHSVVHRVRNVFLQRIKTELDIPSLYFYPTTWLNLSYERLPLSGSVVEIDGLRKQIMPADKSHWRRCVRCGSISVLDDIKTTKFPSNWTVAFQRSCICGSAWVKY
ncbi:mediator complex, subunit Med16 [Dipodascopsis uninucleata]